MGLPTNTCFWDTKSAGQPGRRISHLQGNLQQGFWNPEKQPTPGSSCGGGGQDAGAGPIFQPGGGLSESPLPSGYSPFRLTRPSQGEVRGGIS